MKTTVTTAIALTALLSAGFASGTELVQFSPGTPARAADFNDNFNVLSQRADNAENRINALEEAAADTGSFSAIAAMFMATASYSGALVSANAPFEFYGESAFDGINMATVNVSAPTTGSYTRVVGWGWHQCDFANRNLQVGTSLRSIIMGACTLPQPAYTETETFTLNGGNVYRTVSGATQMVLPANVKAGETFDASVSVQGATSPVRGHIEYVGPYNSGLQDFGTCAVVTYKPIGIPLKSSTARLSFAYSSVQFVFCEDKGYIGATHDNSSGFSSLVTTE